MVVLEGRMLVQASYGEGGWVGNLRAAHEAVLTDGPRRIPVQADELPPEEAATLLRSAFAGFHRSRLLRAFVGPSFRPPIGVLWQLHVRIDDTPAEYLAEARRHPLFELRPIASAS